jgi:serine/threonine protein kinase
LSVTETCRGAGALIEEHEQPGVENPVSKGELGSYHLLREVGRGAMGVVYEATAARTLGDRPAGSRVALKLLVFPPLMPPGERPALIQRFEREARALAAVRHPNVVEVYEVGEADGQPFMAMEFLVGVNAREWLSRHGPLSAEETVRFGQQLCDALAAVHAAGIVHRDVKPDNLVLEADGRVRLTDFGIARMEVEATLTRTGGLIGSPAYMAPEQILGGPLDSRTDLFAAGVTLYQMLTGSLPFPGSTLMEMAHRVAYEAPRPLTGVAPKLSAVLLKALEKEPARRFADAVALRDALISSLSSPTFDGPGEPATGAGPRAAAGTELLGSRSAGGDGAAVFSGRRRGGGAGQTFSGIPWVVRLEVLGIGLLFAALLWSLYPLRW